MTNKLKIECLNAAGLVKPDKAAFMETVEQVLSAYNEPFSYLQPPVKTLIGQVLRFYQHWPHRRTETLILEWIMQAYNPTVKNEKLQQLYRDGEWVIASDGHRVHKAISTWAPATALDISESDAPNFTSFFPALGQQRPLKLSDFRNVETDLLVWNGFTYLERYILEAFSGNRIMLTPDETRDQLLLKSEDGNRAACIAPLRS